ncbi:MAG: histidine kinase [Hymenobacteraceae bacterium]|nr:histidine kinase [Hymenobacteraceae bacterium]MDX5396365.1 histidine kinase [Hymenobacteraceae bacterium]MDX5512427.1 histidine kinase [Hymenobacteraceae bacterium]
MSSTTKRKNVLIAAQAVALSVIYTCMIAFIIYGSLHYPANHLVFDLCYGTVYFWLLYEGYNRTYHFLQKKFSTHFPDYKRYLIGYFIFVLYSLLLFLMVGLLPFLLLFDSFVNPEFAEAELRLNFFVIALVASVYYAVLSSYHILRNYHYSKLQSVILHKEIAQAQYEIFRSQVNPHFLFNSLNVLSALISLDPQLAEKFTEQLSKVYRYVLEHQSKDMVQLHTEVDFVQSYLFLLDIRFRDKLEVNLNIPATFQATFIPPLTLQLLIENAIKHNSLSKTSPLIINIYIDELENLCVTNNLQNREKSGDSTGVGLQNIRNRYRYLTTRKAFFGLQDDVYLARVPLL